ncbi:mitotic spindle assembly checkpoint protein MAD2B [Anthonomus grandis grandis]|uniref:mitotic spindle assembly checkpoint protein MAD2B n=1 Tax=Anthonomus grandis grandis TaxID=2921223 RepID=UPI0021651DB1|nr:mitotic spindle assembly checkpoint protein MAD2B [Anthonomus grandis grandis]
MSSRNLKQETLDILTEFLEIAINNILYIRKLYPLSIFLPKKKYCVTVYQVVHPEVSQYIKDTLRAVRFHLQKNQLKKVFVCFEDQETIVDRFVIDVLVVQDLVDSDPFLVNLEQSLRTILLKLHAIPFYLDDTFSDEASFSIRIETSMLSTVEFNSMPAYEDFPWIEQETEQDIVESETSIVPIHMLDSDSLKLQFYVEKKQN